MKGLNNYSISEIKNEISTFNHYLIYDIRLFGSIINGNYTDKSDLDVAIKDLKKINYPLFYANILGMNVEIRFVENFKLSWLNNSV
jgi:predicted nucleotidyltransferase